MAMAERTLETEVLIIGAGVTGSGVMRDLALRGIHCLLIDQGDIDAGASGANHGLLHSGGRYVVSDPATAAECRREGELLKRLAPHCVDDCGGLFVAFEGDDPDYAAGFGARCRDAGIPCRPLTPAQAREREPALGERLVSAWAVPDASVDPFRLTLCNLAHARALTGSGYLPHTRLEGFDLRHGAIHSVLCRDPRSGEPLRIRARQVVNATGAWAMAVARLAGCRGVRLDCVKGTLLITASRLTHGVVNRLRPPADGDILVPGGSVSLLGTTSDRVDSPDAAPPTVAEVDRNLAEAVTMVPALADARFIRAFSGVRPVLAGSGGRGFHLFDHDGDGPSNLATITGGKLTTFRLMAQRTADLVARRLGVDAPCRTADEPLPEAEAGRWTEPGYAPRRWYARGDTADPILCECEMVPASAVDAIGRQAGNGDAPPDLRAIGVRSRVGKGSCQGAFCSIRVTAHLYDRGVYRDRDGLARAREFVEHRFRGVRPVLWGAQMPQAELAEALHRGLMGLDLPDGDGNGEEG